MGRVNLLRRLGDRQELQLAAALWRADRLMAAGWWSLLGLRGLLPAVFSIATGVLVGSIEHQSSLAVPLALVGLVFSGQVPASEFERMRVTSPGEQSEFLSQVRRAVHADGSS